jgi:hypothetical protein
MIALPAFDAMAANCSDRILRSFGSMQKPVSARAST